MSKKINIKEKILSQNDKIARRIKNNLTRNGVFSINIMASPGAGKTSLILKTVEKLKKKMKIICLVGDPVEVDVLKIKKHNIPVYLVNTGGACHLDAVMVKKALKSIKLSEYDLLIVENVGNLICPANFDIGSDQNVVIASIPEGDDKPYKYPSMFRGADVVILNKIDYKDEFNIDYFRNGVGMLNKELEFFKLSCKTEEGLSDWIYWLEAQTMHLREKVYIKNDS